MSRRTAAATRFSPRGRLPCCVRRGPALQAALRTLARLDLPLTDLVSRINDVIYQNTGYDKFITAFFGIIDTRTGRFSYVNAGHNPPFVFTESGVQPLELGGLILGIIALGQSKTDPAKPGQGLAIAGIAVSVAALVLFGVLAAFGAFREVLGRIFK